jgi:hypothetical protein
MKLIRSKHHWVLAGIAQPLIMFDVTVLGMKGPMPELASRI